MEANILRCTGAFVRVRIVDEGELELLLSPFNVFRGILNLVCDSTQVPGQ